MNGRGLPGLVVRLALIAAVGAVLLLGAGALGTKFGLIGYAMGVDLITLKLAWYAGLAGVVLGVVALLLSLKDFRRLGLGALIALVAAAAVTGGVWQWRRVLGSVPPIHDVSTNWDDPVTLSRVSAADRQGADNPVELDPRVPLSAGAPWGGKRVAEVNAQTCPGAHPIPHAVDVEDAAKALERAGVQVTAKQAPFRVEGSSETFWFGFKADVAVRIRPERTDIRSISRAGQSDLGDNCRRVTAIVQDLSK